MSVSNIVGNKIDAVKMEIETYIANNIEDIQDENIKDTTALEMKISSIISSQPSSSGHPNTYQLK